MSDDLETTQPGGTAEEFLGQIIDRYREMMFRAARSFTRNDYDADDVIQRVCVRFITRGIPHGLRENPPAYLIRCIVNEAKTLHRTHERRRIDDEADLTEVSETVSCTIENKVLEILEEAKACLTPEEREVLELFYTQGLTQADIAAIKEMEEDAVAQKLSRSRKKMKNAIGAAQAR